MSLFKKIVIECLGSLILVFFGCGAGVISSEVIVTSLAFGITFIVLYQIFGGYSCILNPAIGICLWLKKRISLKEFIIYTISEMVGALIGAFLLGLCLKGNFKNLGGNEITSLLQDNNKLYYWSYISSFIIEFTITGVVTMVFLATLDYEESKLIKGLMIGLAIIICHLVATPLTGTSINPARSFGPAVVQAFSKNTLSLQQFWIWFLAPIGGSIFATIVYSLLFDMNK